MKILTIRDLTNNNLTKDKRIILRVDFNVPIDNGVIMNDQRIVQSLPTIKHLIEHGDFKSIVILSHLGRPKGVYNKKFSLKPVHELLQKLLKMDIAFIEDGCRYNNFFKIWNCEKGMIFLFENIRFYMEETLKVDSNEHHIYNKSLISLFRQRLNALGDIYINDAFGSCHRNHSSIVFSNHTIKACGFLIEKELNFFYKALDNPQRPLVCIVGGAKVSDKIKLITNLIDKSDHIIIGGGMAYTFKKVLNNMKIGKSLFDEEGKDIVNEIIEKAEIKNVKIHLPIDHLIADNFSNESNTKIVNDEDGIDDNWMGLDIGPRTINYFKEVIQKSNTIIWNGPMGVFEMEKFSNGTKEILKCVAEQTDLGKMTIVGGGDTATAAKMFSLDHKISHVSTGGGASLELMEGKKLPGIEILKIE